MRDLGHSQLFPITKMSRVRRFYSTEFSKHADLLSRLGLSETNDGVYFGKWQKGQGPIVNSINPATNEVIASVRTASVNQVQEALNEIEKAKRDWKDTPAPVRGEIVRQMRLALDENKEDLGALVSIEMGKILPEGVGEVQEYIDVCDYAVGLSRTMAGSVIPSESN